MMPMVADATRDQPVAAFLIVLGVATALIWLARIGLDVFRDNKPEPIAEPAPDTTDKQCRFLSHGRTCGLVGYRMVKRRDSEVWEWACIGHHHEGIVRRWFTEDRAA